MSDSRRKKTQVAEEQRVHDEGELEELCALTNGGYGGGAGGGRERRNRLPDIS